MKPPIEPVRFGSQSSKVELCTQGQVTLKKQDTQNMNICVVSLKRFLVMYSGSSRMQPNETGVPYKTEWSAVHYELSFEGCHVS
jgi:hypothetical protein